MAPGLDICLRPRDSSPNSVTHSDLSFLLDSHVKLHLSPAVMKNHHLSTVSSQIIECPACSKQTAHARPYCLNQQMNAPWAPCFSIPTLLRQVIMEAFICNFQTTLEGSGLLLPLLDGSLQSQLLPISQSLAHRADHVPGFLVLHPLWAKHWLLSQHEEP